MNRAQPKTQGRKPHGKAQTSPRGRNPSNAGLPIYSFPRRLFPNPRSPCLLRLHPPRCLSPSETADPSVAMSVSELACTYAALILSDDGIPITAEKIATLVKASNLKVESYWPALFAKLLEKRSVEDLILSVGSGGGAAPVAAAAPAAGAAAAAAPAAEEKKEEAKEESDDDMGFSLFD
ncbi:hypothetical protein U9M48_041173 [Paspalum notatum var. saurae]|uniref:60S acidic ribosomal protein P1 n=1 Tax=Paspalum notatum var. saurae TaxID=547442 RepID=A0AAQ3US17_PASNO